MAVSTVQDGNFIRISGTIAEVLAEMKDQSISKATQVSYWTDDNTNAVAICGRLI
jgi:hypothetical protein